MYIQEAVKWTDLTDETLSFYRAVGVDMIHLDIRSGVSRIDPALDLRDGRDSTTLFEQARQKVEAHGLKLNTVFMACWKEITLGRPDMDEKIEAWIRFLECLGQAGIPTLGWNFKPMGNFRTRPEIGRGGVKYSTFDCQ
jgi:D-mannonate dehydratase